MSDTVFIAIVAAIATAVPLLFTQIVALIIGLRSQARQETKIDNADKKLDSIHEQTNSNLTEQKAQIKALNDRIEELIREKAEKAGSEGKFQ